MFAVFGLKGIGKTRLLNEWLTQTKREAKWIFFERFGSPSEVLGFPEEPLERALTLGIGAQSGGKNYSAIVWEDFHLLPPASRKIVLSFIKSAGSIFAHFILSDEDCTDELGLEVPVLRLGPLGIEDLNTLDSDLLSKDQVAQAFNVTSGIPLLLILWLQNPGVKLSFIEKLLDALNPAELLILKLSAVLGRKASASELEELCSPDVEARKYLRSLTNRYFLVESDEFFELASFFKNILVRKLDPPELKGLKARVGQYLSRSVNQDALEVLYFSLEMGEGEKILDAVLQVEPERFESLLKEDLLRFSKAFFEFISPVTQGLKLGTEYSVEKRDAWARAYRIQAKLLHLSGSREGAILVLKQLANHVLNASIQREFTVEEQKVFLELIRMLTRNQRFEEAGLLYAKLNRRLVEPYKTFAAIEKGVELLSKDPPGAVDYFKTLENKSQKSHENIEVASLISFQLARAQDLSGQFREAMISYAQAKKCFEGARQIYSASVASLNLLRVLLKLRDWAGIERLQEELLPEVRRYGYDYIQAGALLVDAIRERLALKCDAAFLKIERCLQLLSEDSPAASRVDALCEKIRILIEMGLFSEAKLAFADLAKIKVGSGSQPYSQADWLIQQKRWVRLELESHSMAKVQWLQEWKDFQPEKIEDPDDQAIYWLGRLRRDPSSLEDPLCKKALTPFTAGQLSLAEARLVSELANIRDAREANEDVWRSISAIENLLQSISVPMLERAGIFLLHAELVEPKQAEGLRKSAQLELSRLSCDLQLKAPLLAWLDASQDGTSVTDYSNWKQASEFDQQRWRAWWGPIRNSQSEKLFKLKTIAGESVVGASKLPAADSNMLFLREDLGEVRFKGKPVRQLLRSHGLRKLLLQLLLAAPECLTKKEISLQLWEELYSSQRHDPRIYMAIQRLRALLGKSSGKSQPIQIWENGYRWNPELPFCVLIPQVTAEGPLGENRLQSLIIESLEKSSLKGIKWLSRTELKAMTRATEATLKRHLLKLVERGLLLRKGAGRATVYAVKTQ